MDSEDTDRIRELAGALRQAERGIRILRTVSWPSEVGERFFARGGRELPEIAYPAFDPEPVVAAVARVRGRLDRRENASPVEGWFHRLADTLERSARMLAAAGTPAFYRHARRLYGSPNDPPERGGASVLELARRLDTTLAGLTPADLGAPDPACHLADGVAATMRAAVERHFGDAAPEVVVVDELSSNALAGPRAIRIRRQACFTDRDVYQLIHHEALVHVGTALNGREQADLPILEAGHAGTTRTQEGLAVFAEFMSGTMDPDRLRRLAARVLAIQMAVEGADFLDVYRFFTGRGVKAEQAFENARRVFRGGVLTGGAPFPKDAVYLDGLLRVHGFLRAAVAGGRTDCIRTLFCGKLDLGDLPALGHLSGLGLLRPPRFLPPWAADLRFLVSFLAYSSFLHGLEHVRIREEVEETLAQTPPVAETAAPQPA